MSVMGTGVAAGVAQAASNAETVARRRDKRSNKTTAETRRVREIFEAHLKTLEEHDEGENTARIYTDSQVPQHESREDQLPAKHRHEFAQDASPPPPGSARPTSKREKAASAYAAADPNATPHAPGFDLTVDPDNGNARAQLYTHLDVQG